MILTGENRSTGRKTCPSATLSTTNLTSTELGLNPGLSDYRPATNRLSHDTALKQEFHLNNIYKFSSYLTVNTRGLRCLGK